MEDKESNIKHPRNCFQIIEQPIGEISRQPNTENSTVNLEIK